MEGKKRPARVKVLRGWVGGPGWGRARTHWLRSTLSSSLFYCTLSFQPEQRAGGTHKAVLATDQSPSSHRLQARQRREPTEDAESEWVDRDVMYVSKPRWAHEARWLDGLRPSLCCGQLAEDVISPQIGRSTRPAWSDTGLSGVNTHNVHPSVITQRSCLRPWELYYVTFLWY